MTLRSFVYQKVDYEYNFLEKRYLKLVRNEGEKNCVFQTYASIVQDNCFEMR